MSNDGSPTRSDAIAMYCALAGAGALLFSLEPFVENWYILTGEVSLRSKGAFAALAAVLALCAAAVSGGNVALRQVTNVTRSVLIGSLILMLAIILFSHVNFDWERIGR